MMFLNNATSSGELMMNDFIFLISKSIVDYGAIHPHPMIPN